MSSAFSLHQFNRLRFDGQAVFFFHINISLYVHDTLSLKSPIITREMKLKLPNLSTNLF